MRRAVAFLLIALWACISLSAAITPDQNWWIRINGSDTNGCGYDSTVSGATTNYANQDAAQLSVSDGATTNGSGTVTSATGGFTSAMIGNAIYISSKGRFVITARTDTNTITVTPTVTGSSTGLTLNVGGACASPGPFSVDSDDGAPSLTSPLAAGHVVNVQGTADTTLQDLPAAATYTDWSLNYTFPSGAGYSTPSTGMIKFLAFDGIVRLDIADTFARISGHIWQGFYWKATQILPNTTMVAIDTATYTTNTVNSWIYDSVFDANGYGPMGTNVVNLVGVGFINSGAGGVAAAASRAAFEGVAGEPAGTNTGRIMGCSFVGWKSVDAILKHPNWQTIEFNLFANNTAPICLQSGTSNYNSSIFANTFYGCSGTAIQLFHAPNELAYLIRNNLIVNSGGYGIEFDNTDDSHIPARFNLMPDYNAFYNNSSGNYSTLVTAGPHDVALSGNPFVNAAGLDFRLKTSGAGLEATATGWPRFFVGVAQ